MSPQRTALRYALIMSCMSLPGAVWAAAASPPAPAAGATHINVSADAIIEAAPDYAEMRVGVVTQALQAKAALEANAARTAQVRKALAHAGISARDIQTNQIQLQPQYRYAENQPPAIIGYQATQQLRVISRDLKQTGPLLDLLVAQGANQIEGPNFGITDMESLRDKARLAAFAKAQERLALYATAAGLKVKRLLDISESAPEVISPQGFLRVTAMEMRPKAASQIDGGTLSVRATVNLQAELE